jgi:hypothetical protein
MRHDGKAIPEAIKRLVEIFVAHSSDRSTLDELHQMAGDRGSWKRAHDLFQRIRRKSLDAIRRGDAKLEVQFGFEEACAKTLYNFSGQSGPFDPDSPYWIIPNALAAARLFEIDESEIIRAIVA